jgi:hypothetical protein
MKYKVSNIIRNDRIDIPTSAIRGSVSLKKTTNNVNAAINEMNRNITSRLVCGNTLTFSGQIRFLGPNGGANYGLTGWKQILEDAIVEALSTFMRKTAGQITPEGITVEPIGFSTTYKVNLPKVVPSVMTVTK